LASIAYFALMLASPKVTAVERSRVRAFILLFIANAAFWSLFQQIFTTLAVYSDERINWNIFGWTAPASWIGSAEPVWIIVLSPLFAVMWTKLGTRAPSTPMKFAIGVVGMGIAFLLFLTMAGSTGQSSPALVVFFILAVFAMSDLMLSPIGLSVTTKLAPDAFRAQMMAPYFFSVGLGTSMSGVLARFYSADNEYAYFGINGAIVIVIGLILAALTPWLRRMMAGVH
jgi:POT family proton-dependent oligopeptide transporter